MGSRNIWRWNLSSVIILLVVSCSSPVIHRDNRGMRMDDSRRDLSQNFQNIRKKIYLFNLSNESPYGGDDLEVTATEELRSELLRTGEFITENVDSLSSSSKEIYAGGGFKLNQLSRQAKLSGIHFIVFGRIIEARVRQKADEIGLVRKVKSFTEAKMELKIYDVHSNKEIYSGITNGDANDGSYELFASNREDKLSYRQELLRYSVKVAVRKLIPKILDIAARLDWMGRVARIIGTKIYVNAGRNSGIQLGDVLKVVTEGEEIYDPETGAMLGMAQGQVKGTIEIIDYFGADGTIAILHSGGAVTEGDFVQLY